MLKETQFWIQSNEGWDAYVNFCRSDVSIPSAINNLNNSG